MAGKAMPTTVVSSAAIPEPCMVTAITHCPGAEENTRAGASAVVSSRTGMTARGRSAGPPGYLCDGGRDAIGRPDLAAVSGAGRPAR